MILTTILPFHLTFSVGDIIYGSILARCRKFLEQLVQFGVSRSTRLYVAVHCRNLLEGCCRMLAGFCPRIGHHLRLPLTPLSLHEQSQIDNTAVNNKKKKKKDEVTSEKKRLGLLEKLRNSRSRSLRSWPCVLIRLHPRLHQL